jgi:hypothetical protein
MLKMIVQTVQSGWHNQFHGRFKSTARLDRVTTNSGLEGAYPGCSDKHLYRVSSLFA